MKLENLKVCTEMQNIAIRASERIEEEAKAYEARIKELESDNLKKTRQIENGMRCTKNLEARIKELEEKLEFSNWSAHDNICGLDEQIKQRDERIKELEFQNGILTDRLKFEKERKPKWISVKDTDRNVLVDVIVWNGKEVTHEDVVIIGSDKNVTHWMPKPPPPTTEKSLSVEEV